MARALLSHPDPPSPLEVTVPSDLDLLTPDLRNCRGASLAQIVHP
jgi:hypothetical protein